MQRLCMLGMSITKFHTLKIDIVRVNILRKIPGQEVLRVSNRNVATLRVSRHGVQQAMLVVVRDLTTCTKELLTAAPP